MSKVIKAAHLLLVGDMDVRSGSTDRGRQRGVSVTLPTPQPKPHQTLTEGAEAQLSDVRAECETLLAQAKQQAKEVLAAAEAEAEALRIRASEQGFAEGFAAGVCEGEAAGRALLAEAQEILEQVEQEQERVFTNCREQLGRAAVQIASRLIDRELKADPDIVGDLAGKALALVRESDRCVIRVNPRDVMIIEERKRALRKAAIGIKTIEIAGDESLEPGEIVVDCDRGQVDGRLTTRMAVAEEIVMEVVHDDNS